MPKKLSTNDMGIKTDVFILESPIIARPTSSGNGDATISAPINGTIYLNILSRKMETSRSCFVVLISQ